MADKYIDMFKLIEEVEKQHSMNIDDIFSNLDSLKNGEVTYQRPKNTVSSSSGNVTLIRKPTIPEDIGTYDTRFSAFRGIIEHVSYGSSGNNDYVEGHKDALQKYYQDAYNNSKDLYVIEARVNDEINRYTSRTQLYEKGYYDGLFYVLKALNRSKELLMNRLNREINQKL
ncbi:MAG: hypothetical protein J5796_03250 [Erysipelotrichaceae bacterium]|nr:hypothetical protein [Erysipelotrichaceae bacterium]